MSESDSYCKALAEVNQALRQAANILDTTTNPETLERVRDQAGELAALLRQLQARDALALRLALSAMYDQDTKN